MLLRELEPSTEIWIVWHGIEHRLNERIGIRAWPGAIVAIGAEFIVIDDVTDFWNQAAGFLAINSDNGFRSGAKPARIGGESVGPDRLAPCGVVVSRIGLRVMNLRLVRDN